MALKNKNPAAQRTCFVVETQIETNMCADMEEEEKRTLPFLISKGLWNVYMKDY